MRTILVIAFVLFSSVTLYAQSERQRFYITGDRVNVRAEPSLQSQIRYQVHWGMTFWGHQVSPEWHMFENIYAGGQLYVASRYVASEADFCQIAKKKPTQNGKVKLELLRCYRHAQAFEAAEDLSFDLINNHMNEEIVEAVDSESCALYGEAAYFTMIGEDEAAPYVLEYTQKVIEQSQDPVILALAHYQQARYYALHGNLEQAEELLFTIITDYPEYLVIPLPCDYDFDSKIFPLRHLKSLFFGVFTLQERGQAETTLNRLNDLLEHSENSVTRALVQDIQYRLFGSFWEYDQYLKALSKHKTE
jgi:tetratricopeptide (TPR) repeat protein